MHQPTLRSKAKPVCHLADDSHRLGRAQGTESLDVVVQIVAPHVLENQVMTPLVNPPIIDRRDVRVLERLGAAGLSQEALENHRISRMVRRQDLERNFVPGSLVNGPIDRAHPP